MFDKTALSHPLWCVITDSQESGLWLVETDHVTWTLASNWLRVITRSQARRGGKKVISTWPELWYSSYHASWLGSPRRGAGKKAGDLKWSRIISDSKQVKALRVFMHHLVTSLQDKIRIMYYENRNLLRGSLFSWSLEFGLTIVKQLIKKI